MKTFVSRTMKHPPGGAMLLAATAAIAVAGLGSAASARPLDYQSQKEITTLGAAGHTADKATLHATASPTSASDFKQDPSASPSTAGLSDPGGASTTIGYFKVNFDLTGAGHTAAALSDFGALAIDQPSNVDIADTR